MRPAAFAYSPWFANRSGTHYESELAERIAECVATRHHSCGNLK